MSFVATAVGGSALIGAGASIYAGQVSANAAKSSSAAMVDAYGRAQDTSIAAGRDALAYLDPYRQMGLNAGSTLQDLLYSPQQRLNQFQDARTQAQAEVDRLQALVPKWEQYPILSGKNASERRAEGFTSDYNIAMQKVSEAQAKLKSIDQQVNDYQQRIQQGTAGFQPQASPWYQFQADLYNKKSGQRFAALGLSGSGFEAESNRQGLLQLGAQETENQFNRLTHLYDIGANEAAAGAGAITGTAQQVANMQMGAGQSTAQGVLGVGQANVGAITGASNAITGSVGAGLTYNQWDKFQAALIARNQPNYASNPNNFGPYPQ